MNKLFLVFLIACSAKLYASNPPAEVNEMKVEAVGSSQQRICVKVYQFYNGRNFQCSKPFAANNAQAKDLMENFEKFKSRLPFFTNFTLKDGEYTIEQLKNAVDVGIGRETFSEKPCFVEASVMKQEAKHTDKQKMYVHRSVNITNLQLPVGPADNWPQVPKTFTLDSNSQTEFGKSFNDDPKRSIYIGADMPENSFEGNVLPESLIVWISEGEPKKLVKAIKCKVRLREHSNLQDKQTIPDKGKG